MIWLISGRNFPSDPFQKYTLFDFVKISFWTKTRFEKTFILIFSEPSHRRPSPLHAQVIYAFLHSGHLVYYLWLKRKFKTIPTNIFFYCNPRRFIRFFFFFCLEIFWPSLNFYWNQYCWLFLQWRFPLRTLGTRWPASSKFWPSVFVQILFLLTNPDELFAHVSCPFRKLLFCLLTIT